MYIFGYLRASTDSQDAKRAKDQLNAFVQDKGYRIASWYVECVSGASLQRPELMRLLDDAQPGDAILVEQIDRLSRLDDAGWQKLKSLLLEKELRVISLDLPTSHMALSHDFDDEFTRVIVRGFNNLMMDMLAVSARKDYLDRRRRQKEGIEKAKKAGKYPGRKRDEALHDRIYELRVINKYSIRETARLTGVSARTVVRSVKERTNED